MRRRDTQKSKVYAAERAARALLDDKNVGSMLGVWTFIERVQRDRWFRRHYGYHRFQVSDGRGTRIARGGGNWLNLPRWSRTPVVMLHEIAHCLTPDDVGHGWRFCATHLALVRHFMGKEAHDRLRACYREHRVRYKQPRTRVLTDEQRAELRERLAKARASRRPVAAADVTEVAA